MQAEAPEQLSSWVSCSERHLAAWDRRHMEGNLLPHTTLKRDIVGSSTLWYNDISSDVYHMPEEIHDTTFYAKTQQCTCRAEAQVWGMWLKLLACCLQEGNFQRATYIQVSRQANSRVLEAEGRVGGTATLGKGGRSEVQAEHCCSGRST